MTRCANNHEPIKHDEFWCPLCSALEDAQGYEDAIFQGEETVRALEAHIEDLSLADVLQEMAEATAARTAAYRANTRLSKLVWAIEAHYSRDNLSKRLGRIEATAYTVKHERAGDA